MPRDPLSGGPPRLGFFGKIPARGDFVRGTLSRAFADAIDAWAEGVLPAFAARRGPDWAEHWVRAGPWRFAAPPGRFGPARSSGVFVPSADRVGRPFPLVVAIEDAVLDDAALAAAEGIGLDAASGHLQPEALERALGTVPPTVGRGGSAQPEALLWWRGDGRAERGRGCPAGAIGPLVP